MSTSNGQELASATDDRKRKSTDETTECGQLKSSRLSCLIGSCRGYYSSKKGEREDMQDEHVILDDYKKILGDKLCPDIETASFYAVYDGHNGPRAAKYSAKHIHNALAIKIPKGPSISNIEQSIKRAFIETYKKIDEEFLAEAAKQKPVWKDGSTCTTILILNNSLFVANLGDSRAILCRYKPEDNKDMPVTLTKDHNPQTFEERMRIQKTGAIVKDGRIMGILEVSRSIGDGQYKKHGVSCIPDVKKCTLTANDKYLVIACDGLWKSFTNVQVLEFINTKHELIQSQDFIKELIAGGKSREEAVWGEVCSQLAGEAVRRGSGDNVTVLIVLLCNYGLNRIKP